MFLLAGCAGNAKTDDNTAKSPDTYRPERAPYDGFVWERLSGAGLVMWAQRSPKTFLQTDASIHGVRLCTLTDNGVSRSEPLVQVFDLKAGQLDSLLPYLLEHPRVESLSENDTVTCAFQQVESGRMGVRRYVLVPTGEGADALKKRMENKPVPTTCGGWGMGNSGMRYFEIFTRRIERLSKNAQMLKELLYQASEAHQAKLDYHMNKTMQLFTVLTSIFMPLTLITGWYGMNFYYMPELKNPYGYLGVIILSISVITISIFWFKKKKFLEQEHREKIHEKYSGEEIRRI